MCVMIAINARELAAQISADARVASPTAYKRPAALPTPHA
jgi:hypothetical protein